MALDENIYKLRLEKLKQIASLGQPAYPRKYDFTHAIPQVLEDYSGKTAEQLADPRVNLRIGGRIMAIRLMGKAGFAHLQQGGKQLQIYVKKDAVGDSGFELYKLLDLGDHIGVKGYLFRTRTGELSVHVEELTFLSKDLLPLPEKWHGLTDVELRYRQRYLDLTMNPEVREVFLKRSLLVQSMRRFMDSHEFVEVETPMMQSIAGGAVARPVRDASQRSRYRSFSAHRAGVVSQAAAGGGIRSRLRDQSQFSQRGHLDPAQSRVHHARVLPGLYRLPRGDGPDPATDRAGGRRRNCRDKNQMGRQEIDWAGANWRRMTMREAIIHYWPEAAGAKPQISDFGSHDSVRNLVERFNAGHAHVAYDPKEPAGKTIANLFEAAAEEHLIQPTIIYEFPVAVSPLAKVKADEPDWAERWEIFAGQMEISNGFSELNDPEEQRRRFEGQLTERERGDEEAHQMDEDYIRALSYGMPPAGGVGVGVDRLAMLLTDSHTIRDVILFPLLRPEKAEGKAGGED